MNHSIKIHPDFRLDGEKFLGGNDLLNFVKKKYPAHYKFLKNLFNEQEFIYAYTSGSTGKPKKIKILKKNLVNSASQSINFFDLRKRTTALINLSSDFIAGKMMWVRAFTAGWHIEICAPENKAIRRKLSEKYYDFGAMVPLQVYENIDLIEKIKLLIIGGGNISFSLSEKLENKDNIIFSTYGMTETLTHIAVKPVNNRARKIFKKESYYPDAYFCLPNINIDTDDRNCLVVDASGVLAEPIITNDLVEIIDKRNFRWLGRYDNIINSGGIKLIPEQIEKKLFPFIKNNFFISSIPDEKLGEKVILIIEGDYKQEINFKKILRKYEMPKKVFQIKKMELTNTGKINRMKTYRKIFTY